MPLVALTTVVSARIQAAASVMVSRTACDGTAHTSRRLPARTACSRSDVGLNGTGRCTPGR